MTSPLAPAYAPRWRIARSPAMLSAASVARIAAEMEGWVGAPACPPAGPRGAAGHASPRGPLGHGWEARYPASRSSARADRWYAACFALRGGREPGADRRSVMRWWRAAGAAAVSAAAVVWACGGA